MRYSIEAACGCSKGKIRRNNEDNFLFDGRYLEAENKGLEEILVCTRSPGTMWGFAVFDGMGGENFGEIAAHSAARQMKDDEKNLPGRWQGKQEYLENLVMQLNDAVVRAKQEMLTEAMGTTFVSFFFAGKEGYMCNVGDSRAYRLRDGQLQQLSCDHVERRPGMQGRKAPLTQYLGIDPEEMLLEPYIVKETLAEGDVYLLCSDGLTDMLTDGEIADLIQAAPDMQTCAEALIQAALDRGGRDNITVIVSKIRKRKFGF